MRRKQSSKMHAHLRKRCKDNKAMTMSNIEEYKSKDDRFQSEKLRSEIRKRKEDALELESNITISVIPSGAFQCGICSQGLPSISQLSFHMKAHCMDNLFQCNMCGDRFNKPDRLSAHLELHTNVVKAFKCGICNAGFLENSMLLKHLQEKHEVLPCLYKCSICLSLFKEVSKLVSHIVKKHPSVGKEYKCGICDKSFTQGSRLSLHVQKHSNSSSTVLDANKSQKSISVSPLRADVKNDGRRMSQTISNIRQGNKDVIKKKSRENSKQIIKGNCRLKATDSVQDREESKINTFADNSCNSDNNDVDDCCFNEDVIPVRSGKRGKKGVSYKVKSKRDKKSEIIKDEEIIALFKKINPETKAEVFDCNVCGQRFQDCSTFTQHRSDHFFNGKFCINCQHCFIAYDNFKDLQKHIDEQKCKGYVCLTCGKSFPLEPILLIHIAKEHILGKTANDDFTCPTCKKVSDNKTAFLRHASSHSEIKCIQCKICRHSFSTLETLYGHLRTVHALIPISKKECKFPCPECNLNLMTLEALQYHGRIVHKLVHQDLPVQKPKLKSKAMPKPKEVTKVKVESSTEKRTGHWRSAEDDKKRRTCPICNKIFSRYKDVGRHIGTHTRPHLCSQCGKSFPYRYTLDSHIKAFHSNKNPFECNVCHRFLSSHRSLVIHKRIHSGEMPHQCPICHKRFRQVSNLSMHIKLHNKDKPIKCPLCDYKCRFIGYLNRHMRTHNPEKKHFCSICNKGFADKPNLWHHIKRHSKIRKYVCTVCGRRFAERYYLNNHMRIHTKEKPYSCPVCSRAFTMRPNMVSHIKKTHPSFNYQPIRRSHDTVAMTNGENGDGNLTTPPLSISLEASFQTIPIPQVSHDNSFKNNGITMNNATFMSSFSSTVSLPPDTLQPPLHQHPHSLLDTLPQPPNIPHPVYHEMSGSNQELKSTEVLSTFSHRDNAYKFSTMLETELPRDHQHHQQQQQHNQQQPQQQYIEDSQMISDRPLISLRDHQEQILLREHMPLQQQQEVPHEDVDGPRRLFAHLNLVPNRVSLENTSGFDPQRDIMSQNFPVPVPLPGPSDLMYSYPNLTNILDNQSYPCAKPFPPS